MEKIYHMNVYTGQEHLAVSVLQQNDLTQHFLHTTSPINLEYKVCGLMAKNSYVYKAIRKKYTLFLRSKILKVQ